MSWFDVFFHALHLVLPALGVAALASAAAKLVWRHDLAHRRWRCLAGWTSLAGVIVVIVGLMVFGQDGRMATYLALCVVCSLVIAWLGFRGRDNQRR